MVNYLDGGCKDGILLIGDHPPYRLGAESLRVGVQGGDRWSSGRAHSVSPDHPGGGHMEFISFLSSSWIAWSL